MSPFRRVGLLIALAGALVASLALFRLYGAQAHAQGEREPVDVPAVVQELLAAVPPGVSGEAYARLLDEHLWNVYSQPDVSREELEAYVERGAEGPGLPFAALALVQFHDPSSAKVILQRSVQKTVSPYSRWYMLNAAPLVLSMGDVWYMGDGTLGDKEQQFAEGLILMAEAATAASLGNVHARRLMELYDQAALEDAALEEADMSELELARWHLSAYLLGTLDSRDYSLLEPILTPAEGPVFHNLVSELSFSANRDFMAPLRGRTHDSGFDEIEARLAAEARQWWSDYADRHPGGGWQAAAAAGFELAGYEITSDLESKQTRSELQRVLDSQDPFLIYNACRLLNEAYGTRFDLELIFHGLKYAGGPFDPSAKLVEYQTRLAGFWRDVLARGGKL